MALMIYQIGDLPLFFNLRSMGDEKIDLKTDRSWRVATAEFTQTPGSHLYTDLGRPISESQTMDLSGMFICEKDSPTGTELYTRLVSMGGLPLTPVIAIRYEECSHVDSGECCTECNKTLDWIVNYGIITKVSPDISYQSSKTPWIGDTFPVKISMQLDTKWKALSAWEWEYRKTRIVNQLSPSLRRESANNIFTIPETFSSLNRQSYFFRWGLNLSKYDPVFWGEKYSQNHYGGVGSDYVNPGEHSFNSDPAKWSASPNSVYAFTEFSDTSGQISITVTRSYGFGANTELVDVSTLDLAQLDTDLSNKGYSGLFGNDRIVTGYAAPFPGFIIRDGEILNGITPRWSYSGSYPGETGRGFNKVEINGESVNFQTAYLHDFGTY